MDVESRIEPLCNTILRCDAENWDTRNKAVLQIIDVVRSYEGQSIATISDAFGPSVFRLLKEPVKSLISDLRSQQVRDVCTLLVTLAKVTGERMKPFLRDSFVNIIEGVKVPNKVMSGYVDDCIQNMIQYCTFKSCIPVILMEFKDNKAKTFREKCLVSVECAVISVRWRRRLNFSLNLISGISEQYFAVLGYDGQGSGTHLRRSQNRSRRCFAKSARNCPHRFSKFVQHKSSTS
jgi:hypothetical protein